MHTKDSVSYSFSPKEQRIRRLWLWLTVIIPIVYVLGALVLGMSAPKASNQVTIIGSGFIGFCVFIGCMWYHCAYKNPGTKLLTLSLISLGCGFLKILADAFKGGESPLLYLFLLGFQILDFWLTFKMREINKRIKLLIVVTAAKLAIPKIKNCWIPENLHQIFSDVIQEYPVCEPLLTDEFNKRQTLFNKISEKDITIAELAKQEFRETLASAPNLNLNSFEWLLQQMPELKEDIENHLKTSSRV